MNQRTLAFILLIVAGAVILALVWYTSQKGEEVHLETEKVVEETGQADFEEEKEILMQAVTTGDIDACQKLENEILQTACRETATITKAKNTGDASLCDSIENESSREKCKEKAE